MTAQSDLDFSRPCARQGCGEYLPESAGPRAKYHAGRCQVADSRDRTRGTQPPKPVRTLVERNALKRRQAAARRALTHANGGVAPTETHNASTWENWSCRCDTCVTAHLTKIHTMEHNALKRQQKLARRALTHANGGIAPTKVHNASTRSNWGCRCDTCINRAPNKDPHNLKGGRTVTSRFETMMTKPHYSRK